MDGELARGAVGDFAYALARILLGEPLIDGIAPGVVGFGGLSSSIQKQPDNMDVEVIYSQGSHFYPQLAAGALRIDRVYGHVSRLFPN